MLAQAEYEFHESVKFASSNIPGSSCPRMNFEDIPIEASSTFVEVERPVPAVIHISKGSHRSTAIQIDDSPEKKKQPALNSMKLPSMHQPEDDEVVRSRSSKRRSIDDSDDEPELQQRKRVSDSAIEPANPVKRQKIEVQVRHASCRLLTHTCMV